MNPFLIVVDSNCDLPVESIEANGIEVLPMPFQLDGREHHMGYWQEISGKEYYDALRNGGVATTTLINPETFLELFMRYAREGREVVFPMLSRGLSGTYNNALIALKEVREMYPDCKIYPIDSLNASCGHGQLALLAAKKRAEGLSAGETAAWLSEMRHKCFSLFTVDDLMYLHRGGRLSKFSAVAGSMLGVKPILNIAPDGTLKLKEKARGRKAAFANLVSQLRQGIAPGAVLDTVLIAHTDCPEDAQTFAGMVRDAISVREIIVMMMGPVIGAHLGPGAVTLHFEADMTREEYGNKF